MLSMNCYKGFRQRHGAYGLVEIIQVFLLCTLCLLPTDAFAQRHYESLNFGWEFRLDNEGDWRKVDVPHDFQIEQPWVEHDADNINAKNNQSANKKNPLTRRGFKKMAKGYYRLHYTPSKEMEGQRVLLDFEGIMYTADVFLNHKNVGGTDYGYVGFEINISDELKYGENNLIEVVADTRETENSRWYTGGGLYRNVSIVTMPKDLYFNRHPLYITTRDNRYVSISAEFTDRTKDNITCMALQITDPKGGTVFSDTINIQRHRMTNHQEVCIANDIEIADAKIWDLDTPYLYHVKAQLLRQNGTVADETTEAFGFRTIEFGPQFGFKLNGRKVLFKGHAGHHDLGALGAAAYPKAIEKRIKLLKQFGINHIRTSHNPYSRDFIRLCDENGILVVDELYDKWTQQYTGGKVPFEQHWQEEVPEWVKRDRNSPSVVLWSLGNELQQMPDMPYNDFGITMYQLQKTLLQRYDTTRLVTVAMHPGFRHWDTSNLPCELAMITDIQSYNYRYMYFPGDGRQFPWMIFYQSEATTSGMGQNFFEMNLDKVVGLAYWGVIDYLGESLGWPAKGWNLGVFDISLEPKPKAFLMKSFMKPEEPLVYISISNISSHWNWKPGSELEIITYTNADEVELILNGKHIGRKNNPKSDPQQRNQIHWPGITYADGYLEAIAYSKGKIVARHKIETAGKAVRLRVTPEDDIWCADGTDLMHLRIEAIDNKGRRVPMAHDELHFSVEGEARIVAVTDGDIKSGELNVTDHRHLYNGSAMVILRSGKTPSKIKLKTTSMGFKPVITTLQTI